MTQTHTQAAKAPRFSKRTIAQWTAFVEMWLDKHFHHNIIPALSFSLHKDGKPLISVGSPGGPTIITTVLQILVNFFDLKMSLSEALAAPRMSQKNSDTTLIEPSLLGTITANILMKKGHKWSLEPAEIGAANAIFFGADGTVTAVSEPSRHGRGSALIESNRPIAKPSPKSIHSKVTLGGGLPGDTVYAT